MSALSAQYHTKLTRSFMRSILGTYWISKRQRRVRDPLDSSARSGYLRASPWVSDLKQGQLIRIYGGGAAQQISY